MALFKRVEQTEGDVKPVTVASDSGGAARPDILAIAASAQERKRGRGRPPGSKNKDAEVAQPREVTPEMSAALDRMFTPEAWESLVRAPGDIMLAVTGRELWNIGKNETRSMSVSVSTAARYFATTDPKYLALALAFFNVAVVYGGRTMAHLQLNKKERAVAEAKKNAAKPDIGDR